MVILATIMTPTRRRTRRHPIRRAPAARRAWPTRATTSAASRACRRRKFAAVLKKDHFTFDARAQARCACWRRVLGGARRPWPRRARGRPSSSAMEDLATAPADACPCTRRQELPPASTASSRRSSRTCRPRPATGASTCRPRAAPPSPPSTWACSSSRAARTSTAPTRGRESRAAPRRTTGRVDLRAAAPSAPSQGAHPPRALPGAVAVLPAEGRDDPPSTGVLADQQYLDCTSTRSACC